VLTTPSADQTLSQQVQQALADESGYVQAGSATLSTPTSPLASQLQTLATSAESSLVPLNMLATGASNSVSGTSNLVFWAHSASTASNHSKASNQNTSGSDSNASASTGSSYGLPAATPQGLPSCDQNIQGNTSTSCSFADSVFGAYARDVQGRGAGSYDVEAFSSATGNDYTDTCSYNTATGLVDCSHGSDLVQFPEWAAAVYVPQG
jgi:hypothetical protein